MSYGANVLTVFVIIAGWIVLLWIADVAGRALWQWRARRADAKRPRLPMPSYSQARLEVLQSKERFEALQRAERQVLRDAQMIHDASERRQRR
jgi:hypothetical protein